VGFNQDLGLRREPDGAIRLDPDARHEVAPGTIHFAVLATLGEVAAAQAVDAAVVPAHLSVQLVRRATSTSPLVARGRVVKAGRTLIFAEGEVSQGGERVALVAATFARIG
jgi:acyl-coenzyme A thioesterase PaaI-like protein